MPQITRPSVEMVTRAFIVTGHAVNQSTFQTHWLDMLVVTARQGASVLYVLSDDILSFEDGERIRNFDLSENKLGGQGMD